MTTTEALLNTEPDNARIYYQRTSRHVLKRLSQVAETHTVLYDDPKQLTRSIAWGGPGWYSMDDSNVYRPGKFATYSRIKVC